MVVDKKDIILDYFCAVEEEFVPIDKEMWIIFQSEEYVWASRCMGFFKMIDCPYHGEKAVGSTVRDITWVPGVWDAQEKVLINTTLMGGKIIGITFQKPSGGHFEFEEEIDVSNYACVKLKIRKDEERKE